MNLFWDNGLLLGQKPKDRYRGYRFLLFSIFRHIQSCAYLSVIKTTQTDD